MDQEGQSSFKAQHSLGAYHMPSAYGNTFPFLSKDLQRAYKDFYAGLTKEQLATLGTAKPHPSNLSGECPLSLKENHAHIGSPTETDTDSSATVYDLLSTERDPADIDDEPTSPDLIPALIVLEIIRKVLHAWTSAPDRSTRLHGEVLGIALGVPGESVSSLARKYGCTRQAISKRHRSVIKALSLPPNTRMLIARSKAAQVLQRKNIAIPTKKARQKFIKLGKQGKNPL